MFWRPTSPAPALVMSVHVSAANCSTMAHASDSRKRPSFKQRVLIITHGRELSIAAMQKVVAMKSSTCAEENFPTSLPQPAPFQPDDVDIHVSPFTIIAPSSGGSNNFDGFHEQLDTQLLPTSHEPPTNSQKNLKKMYLNPKPWLYFLGSNLIHNAKEFKLCMFFSFSCFSLLVIGFGADFNKIGQQNTHGLSRTLKGMVHSTKFNV